MTTSLRIEVNDPARAGQRASMGVIFGEFHRFRVFAVHTRQDDVSWFVTDAELEDEVTGQPRVIRQADTFAGAVDGLAREEELERFIEAEQAGDLV